MADVKIKWRVQPAPTGMMAAFKRRLWPHGFVGEKAAIILTSEKTYHAKIAGEPGDAHISIHIADYSERPPRSAAFVWRPLNIKAETLSQAKSLAQRFLNENPEKLIPSILKGWEP